MPTAKKLPSGSWRCQVFSHKDDDGKRIYMSFTSKDTSKRGKAEAERMASEYLEKNNARQRKAKYDAGSLTLGEAIDLYIAEKEKVGRSPTTIQGYKVIRKNAFPAIMNTQLRDIDEDILNRAIKDEAKRTHNKWNGNTKAISAKCIHNEWGLASSALHRYWPHINFNAIDLPKIQERHVKLPAVRDVMDLVRGTSIELPVLLAMWLSFSLSEIRGLTKSKSISADGNYISIEEVVVDIGGKAVTKSDAKNDTRKRTHRIPEYIKDLIDQLPDDQDALVAISGQALSARWAALQQKSASWDPITFHDLRHMNASVMALLRIPDKYAQERGGWKTDKVMKRVYMNTFPEERVKVDDTIDEYFMQHAMQHEK